MTVPNAIVDASIQIRRPRLWALEHSACQDGIVAVLRPKIHEGEIISTQRGANNQSYHFLIQ